MKMMKRLFGSTLRNVWRKPTGTVLHFWDSDLMLTARDMVERRSKEEKVVDYASNHPVTRLCLFSDFNELTLRFQLPFVFSIVDFGVIDQR